MVDHWRLIKRAVLWAAVVVALLPQAAAAHASIISSRPGAGEELRSAPGVVVLIFSEPIDTTLSRANVIAPDGSSFGPSGISEQDIQISLSTNLPGIYQVHWTTVSAVDGHTLSGGFRFGVDVNPGAAGVVATSSPQGWDLVLAACRALEIAALLLAIGILLLRQLAPPHATWARPPHLAYALYVALVSGTAVVLIEVLEAAGGLSPGSMLAYLTAGLPGYARVARLVLEAAALSLTLFRTRLVPAPLVLALIALAAAGHAAALRPAAPAIAVDAIHLISAGLWAGGILALALTRPPGGWLGPDGRALLHRFSGLAVIAFTITALTGLIQATEELNSPFDLLSSTYGNVLGAKVLAIGAMLLLSLLAWRRIRAWPKLEAAAAILVIGASALLASFPLPLARLAEANAQRGGLEATVSEPRPDDLTLGSNAGNTLVGLSIRPARPGVNSLLVYFLPLRGEAAAEGDAIRVSLAGNDIGARRCGLTCYAASAVLNGGEIVRVDVAGDGGGTASFQLPALPAADGRQLLQTAAQRMLQLHAYRIAETLGPARIPLHTDYVLEAPDRLQYMLATGSETVFIGATRYSRDTPTTHWSAEDTSPIRVPTLIWTQESIQGARIVGADETDGVPTQVVTFFEELDGGPIWFRLWIDAQGFVRRAEMRAPAHFMDHRYFDFDGAISIVAPIG